MEGRTTALEAAALLSRFALATVFVFAGLSKLGRRPEFAGAVRGYALLPERVVPAVAAALPPLELAAGILLALGLLTALAAAALAALVAAFAVAIAVNLLRGREIDCGCFGAAAPRRIGWGAVGRNLVLALLAIAVAVQAPRPLALDHALFGGKAETSTGDAAALLVAATAAVVAFAVCSAALRVHRRTSPFRQGESAA